MKIEINIAKDAFADVWTVAAEIDRAWEARIVAVKTGHAREESFASDPLCDEMIADAIGQAKRTMLAELRGDREREKRA